MADTESMTDGEFLADLQRRIEEHKPKSTLFGMLPVERDRLMELARRGLEAGFTTQSPTTAQQILDEWRRRTSGF